MLEAVERVHSELGVDSIPTLVVDGRYLLHGVATAEGGRDVLRALRQVAREGPSGKRLFFVDQSPSCPADDQ